MKVPFNLEAYKADPSRKVVTRDGRPVRILTTDIKDPIYPVVATYTRGDPREYVRLFTSEGRYFTGCDDSSNDLFFELPDPKEYWVNVFRDPDFGPYSGINIYWSQKIAEEKGSLYPNYLTSIKIWEE